MVGNLSPQNAKRKVEATNAPAEAATPVKTEEAAFGLVSSVDGAGVPVGGDSTEGAGAGVMSIGVGEGGVEPEGGGEGGVEPKGGGEGGSVSFVVEERLLIL